MENDVVLLSFPPHTTHKLRPLDRTIYWISKEFVNNAYDKWLKNQRGKTMTIYDMLSILNQSLPNALTPKTQSPDFWEHEYGRLTLICNIYWWGFLALCCAVRPLNPSSGILNAKRHLNCYCGMTSIDVIATWRVKYNKSLTILDSQILTLQTLLYMVAVSLQHQAYTRSFIFRT
jgi:hypothetical protein